MELQASINNMCPQYCKTDINVVMSLDRPCQITINIKKFS